VPGEKVNVSATVPEDGAQDGATELVGAATITLLVVLLVAVPDPPILVAVTIHFIPNPTSPATGTYVELVAVPPAAESSPCFHKYE